MIKLDLQFFGGRGASSGGGGGKGSASGELTLPNGTKIEFEGKLNFDGNDPNLTGATRQAITSWEDKRRKQKIEYAYATDANGNPIGKEIRGGKSKVRTPIQYHASNGGTFTHIHPRSDGMLGGTFSGADLNNFANFSQRTMRAAAKEGTYSISKGANFNPTGFKKHVAKAQKDFNTSYQSRVNAIYNEYKVGKITYAEYKTRNAKAFNTALVELHEAYRSKQKDYGYTYTLERSN